MANQPRDDNPARGIRVEDPLWEASQAKAKRLKVPGGVSGVVRDALRHFVSDDYQPTTTEENAS